MEMSIGFLSTGKVLHINNFLDNGEVKRSSYELDEQLPPKCDAYIIQADQIDSESSELSKYTHLQQNHSFWPCATDTKLGLALEDFQQIPFDLGKKVYSQIQNFWSLTHNLHSIENIFNWRDKLFKELQKSRELFFTCFADFIVQNISCSDLKIIFKDLDGPVKSNNEELNKKKNSNKLSNKLKVKSLNFDQDTSSESSFSFMMEDSVDLSIMQEYQNKVPAEFKVWNFKSNNELSRETTASFQLGSTPVVLMIKSKQGFTSLHESLFKSLINGLELKLSSKRP